MDSNGVNVPLAVLTFFAGAGASLGGILLSLLAAIFVPTLGKVVDAAVRAWIAERNNRWRERAIAAEAEIKRLKDAEQLSG